MSDLPQENINFGQQTVPPASSQETTQPSVAPTPVEVINTQPTSTRGQKIQKILVIAVSILLLLIASETAYYFISVKGKGYQYKNVVSPPTNTSNNCPAVAVMQPAEEITFNFETLENFIDLLKGTTMSHYTDSAFLHYSFSGTVIEAKFEEKIVNDFKYEYYIKIAREGTKPLVIGLTDREVEETKVNLTFPEGKNEEVSLNEIKEGDIAMITITNNLLDAPPHFRVIFNVSRPPQ